MQQMSVSSLVKCHTFILCLLCVLLFLRTDSVLWMMLCYCSQIIFSAALCWTVFIAVSFCFNIQKVIIKMFYWILRSLFFLLFSSLCVWVCVCSLFSSPARLLTHLFILFIQYVGSHSHIITPCALVWLHISSLPPPCFTLGTMWILL